MGLLMWILGEGSAQGRVPAGQRPRWVYGKAALVVVVWVGTECGQRGKVGCAGSGFVGGMDVV